MVQSECRFIGRSIRGSNARIERALSAWALLAAAGAMLAHTLECCRGGRRASSGSYDSSGSGSGSGRGGGVW